MTLLTRLAAARSLLARSLTAETRLASALATAVASAFKRLLVRTRSATAALSGRYAAKSALTWPSNCLASRGLTGATSRIALS